MYIYVYKLLYAKCFNTYENPFFDERFELYDLYWKIWTSSSQKM